MVPLDHQSDPYHEYALFKYFTMSEKTYRGRLGLPTIQAKFEFDKELFNNVPDFHNITGFLQSEKYFLHIEDEIRSEFTFKTKYMMPLDNYVAVHVRRGDYVFQPSHHPVQSIKYYQDALDIVGRDYPVAVFSDDLAWARDNIKADYYSEFSTTNRDMYLMTKASHNIISNSSFSWWGAWLNQSPDKVVVAPNKWFGPALADHDTSDLIPSSWIKIDD